MRRWVVVPTILVACSDLGGLSGDAPDAGGAADTGAPIAADDGGTVPEAASPFCASRSSSFCDDFDQNPLGLSWSEKVERGGGFLQLADIPVVSAPHSLHARIVADASVDGGHAAMLWRDYTGAPSKLVCSASIRVVHAETGDRPTVFFLGFTEDGRWCGAGLDVGANDSKFWTYLKSDGGMTTGDGLNTSAVPLNKWFRAELETDFASAKLRIDGISVGELLLPQGARTEYEFAAGVDTETFGNAEVFVDDVVCDVTP